MKTCRTIREVVSCSLAFVALTSGAPTSNDASSVKSTTCNGAIYTYEELAGYGFLPSNDRDKIGDTLGGIGSSIAMDTTSWRKQGKSYTGLLYALPDRG